MKIILAPMEGIIDNYMRTILTNIGGFNACVTEFIRVTDQLLPNKVFYRMCPELKQGGHTPSGTPVIVQLLGSDPDIMAENARLATNLGAPGIDLNFGCPAKCVNKKNGGAVLLKEPDTIFNIVNTVRKTVNDSIPVSAKIRLGYENTELAIDNALAVQEAGADFITVHARTKVDGYKAPARWEWLAKIVDSVNIPVIANGDINSVEDLNRCIEISNCENIMIGRGAVARPDLGRQLSHHLMNQTIEPLSWPQVITLVINFSQKMRTTVCEKKTIARIKQWLGMLRLQYHQAITCFNEIRRITNYTDVQTCLLIHKSSFSANLSHDVFCRKPGLLV